jgi:hypothetical protein
MGVPKMTVVSGAFDRRKSGTEADLKRTSSVIGPYDC